MGETFLIFSVLFQMCAVAQAVRLALRQHRTGWVFLALAIVLMLARRAVTISAVFLHQRPADSVAEFIALIISVLLLAGLTLLLKWGQPGTTGETASDDAPDGAMQRLKRRAVQLALLSLLAFAGMSYFAYTGSRDAVTHRIIRGSLDLASMLETAVRSAPDKPAALEQLGRLWRDARSQYPDNYLCVISADGKLLLNTRRPEKVGVFVGATEIPAGKNAPRTVQELVAARRDWAGRNRNSEGDPQIAAYAYSTNLNALVAVHLPARSVDVEIRTAALPWGAGIALIFLIVLPLSFGLLFYVGSASQKTALVALQHKLQSEQRLRLAVTAANVGLWDWDVQTNAVWFSPEWKRQIGYEDHELPNRFEEWQNRVHPDDLERARATIKAFCEKSVPDFESEFRLRHKSGSFRWILAQGALIADAQGKPLRMLGSHLDITERKRAEAALRASEEQFRRLIEHAPEAVVLFDTVTGKFTQANPAAERLFKFTATQLSLLGPVELSPPNQPDGQPSSEKATGLIARVLAGETPIFEWTHRDAEGRDISCEVCLLRLEIGGRVVVRGSITDIAQRKLAEEALNENHERYRRAIIAANAVPYQKDYASDTYLFMGDGIRTLTGYAPTELRANVWQEMILEKVFLGEAAGLTNAEATRRAIAGELKNWRADYRIRTRNGEIRWISDSSIPIFDATGKYKGSLGIIQDVTERKEAAAQLQRREEQFRELAETIEDVFWITDPARQQILYVSPAYETVWGRTCESLYHEPLIWLQSIHPDDRERLSQAMTTKLTSGQYDEEYRIMRPDGGVRWIRDRAFPVRDAAGEVERVVGVARDVTERRKLEEQLRQSQKLEAIGQLAGGVAHDFNNILAAMMMQTELTAMTPGLPKEAREGLREITLSAERAASLTRQLLLFGRRQVMQPRRLDLNELVISLTKMLQRIVGEDVRMQLHLHSTPLFTDADPGMLDQVLLNLVVNARDAMPDGGRLIIETTAQVLTEIQARAMPDASPGRFVCVHVNDTGRGIPAEILPHIFEPFFTTKDAGKGTGLGLATVFGIVKQHRGFITVGSTPGQGTLIRVFLPAAEPVAASDQPADAIAPAKPRGGTETILLVEDDPSVRLLTRVVLQQQGYKIVEAANGVAALRLWKEHAGQIQLLLTDVVMPEGMTGRELARQLQQDRPDLKVIFTSGYSAELAGRELTLKAGQLFLQKPSPSHQLLETVRRCLDS